MSHQTYYVLEKDPQLVAIIRNRLNKLFHLKEDCTRPKSCEGVHKEWASNYLDSLINICELPIVVGHDGRSAMAIGVGTDGKFKVTVLAGNHNPSLLVKIATRLQNDSMYLERVREAKQRQVIPI